MMITYDRAMAAELLDAETERALIARWQESGDRRALERLIESHARLVYAQVRRWKVSSDVFDDLAAAGFVGLLKAADKHDGGGRARFSSYALRWIVPMISEEFQRQRTILSMPTRTFHDLRAGRLAADRRMEAEAALYGRVRAREQGDDDDPDTPPEDRVACDAPGAAQLLEAQGQATFLAASLRDAISKMPATDRDVISRRNGATPQCYETIARETGMSVAMVRRTEARAMGRMRRRLLEIGCTPDQLAS